MMEGNLGSLEIIIIINLGTFCSLGSFPSYRIGTPVYERMMRILHTQLYNTCHNDLHRLTFMHVLASPPLRSSPSS